MTTKDFGIREGEKAVELPDRTDAGLYFIGRIHTPWKERKDCPKNARESEAVCTVEVDPLWQEALKDVETCSHIVLLLDGQITAKSRAAGACAPGRPARHIRAALSCPAKSCSDERRQAVARRW